MDNQGDDLTIALDGAGQPLHRLRLDEPSAGKAQLQEVQVDFQTRHVHDAHAYQRASNQPIESSLCEHPHRNVMSLKAK